MYLSITFCTFIGLSFILAMAGSIRYSGTGCLVFATFLRVGMTFVRIDSHPVSHEKNLPKP
jgi:hypothetical protein